MIGKYNYCYQLEDEWRPHFKDNNRKVNSRQLRLNESILKKLSFASIYWIDQTYSDPQICKIINLHIKMDSDNIGKEINWGGLGFERNHEGR